jgi:hypothetical protein
MSVDPRAAELFALAPVNRFFGSRLVHKSAERVEVRAPVSVAVTQEYGIVQGGEERRRGKFRDARGSHGRRIEPVRATGCKTGWSSIYGLPGSAARR